MIHNMNQNMYGEDLILNEKNSKQKEFVKN